MGTTDGWALFTDCTLYCCRAGPAWVCMCPWLAGAKGRRCVAGWAAMTPCCAHAGSIRCARGGGDGGTEGAMSVRGGRPCAGRVRGYDDRDTKGSAGEVKEGRERKEEKKERQKAKAGQPTGSGRGGEKRGGCAARGCVRETGSVRVCGREKVRLRAKNEKPQVRTPRTLACPGCTSRGGGEENQEERVVGGVFRTRSGCCARKRNTSRSSLHLLNTGK